MFLHIGNGKNIKTESIIGIFDIDSSTVSSTSRAFIRAMERKNSLEYNDDDIPRSFILISSEKKTEKKGRERRKNKRLDRKENTKFFVNLSKISSVSLQSRLSNEFIYYDISE